MSNRTPPPLHFTDSPFESVVSEKVLKLWNLPQFEQRTPEWYAARTQCISASAASQALLKTESVCRYYLELFGDLNDEFTVDPSKSCSYKESLMDLVRDKCGYGTPFSGNEFTEWGQKFEPVVATVYSQMKQIDVLEFGLILDEKYSFLGASPDGITTEGIMLEIKCPPCRPVKPYPPIYYFIQMMLQLQCTGLQQCDYFDAHFLEYGAKEDWLKDAEAWVPELHHTFGIICKIDGVNTYPPPGVVTPQQFLDWMESVVNPTTASESDVGGPDEMDFEGQDFDEPMDDFAGGSKTIEVTYYKLNKYYLSTVYANQEWYDLNIPTLGKAWETIMYYRTDKGQAELKKEFDVKEAKKQARKDKKKASPPVGYQYSVCLV